MRFLTVPIYGFIVATALWCYNNHVSAFRNVLGAYKQGFCKQTEGIVSNFVPMPSSGHTKEMFEVNGTRFEYSDFDLTNPGFRNTKSHGGPIDEGVNVHIWYVPDKSGNCIARLDVASKTND